MNHNELSQLVANYRPEPAILAGLSAVRLVMVVGPTGVGKSTLIKASGLPEAIGDASRPPRAGEVDGVDYHFRTLPEMIAEARCGRYVQLALGSEDDLKATHADSFPPQGPVIFAVAAAAVDTFRRLPFATTVTLVIVPPDYEVWMRRIGNHHTAPDKLALRMEEARRSYEFALQDTACQFVLNTSLALAAGEITTAAAGHVPASNRQARQVATELLSQLTTSRSVA
jgi:guanylate kinase